MARKLVVEIVGDATSLQKSYATAAKSTKAFSREVEAAGRGALSGTGAFRNLGRTIAFASGGFIAFHELSGFLTDSINAAREAGVAQRSLAAQMKASGESFRANREQIEKIALSYGKFGFQNDEVIQSLTVLERGTGNLNKALKLQMLTADLARAKNMDLAAAAQVVAKVFGGQETALRRAVPGLEKNAHGWDLIREAQRKMAGQAAANTTVSERFAATLHDTEEIIGTALLPTLNKYLTSLGNWLQRMNESGRLQRDVAKASKFLGDALAVLKDILGLVTMAFDSLKSIVGGTKNALYALAAAFALFKGAQLVGGITGIATAIGGVGTAAEASTASVGALRLALIGPGGLVAAAGIAGLAMQRSLQNAFEGAQKAETQGFQQGDPVETILVPRLAKQLEALHAAGMTFAQAYQHLLVQLGGSLKVKDFLGEALKIASGSDPALNARINAQAQARAQEAGNAAVAGAKKGLDNVVKRTAAQRNTFFDDMISRLLGGVSAGGRGYEDASYRTQFARLGHIYDLLKRRLAITKDITRQLKLQDELASVVQQMKDVGKNWQASILDSLDMNVQAAGTNIQAQIAGLKKENAYIAQLIKTQGATHDLVSKYLQNQQQITQLQQQAAEQRKEAARQAAEALKAAQVKKLQTRLDWAEFALERAQTTKGLKDDIRALKLIIRLIKEQIRTTGLTVDLARQLFEARQQLRDALHPKRTPGGAGGGGGGGGGGGVYTPPAMGPAITLLPPGRRTSGPTGLSTGGSTYTGDIHVYGVQNPREFEAEMQRRSQQRPQTRRGPV